MPQCYEAILRSWQLFSAGTIESQRCPNNAEFRLECSPYLRGRVSQNYICPVKQILSGGWDGGVFEATSIALLGAVACEYLLPEYRKTQQNAFFSRKEEPAPQSHSGYFRWAIWFGSADG